jgi:hypothetical protein
MGEVWLGLMGLQVFASVLRPSGSVETAMRARDA